MVDKEGEIMKEIEILKLVKDVEGKLVIDVSNTDDQNSAFEASEELEKTLVKELKEQGFEEAVKTINSCNRMGD